MKSTVWRESWHWFPGVIISIITLIILFRSFSWHELLQALSSLRPQVLFIGAILTLILTLARAKTWHILLESHAKFSQTFHILNIGFMINNILPFRSGEIGRAILMGKSSNLGTFHVLSTIVIERSYDLAIAASFILTTLPLVLDIDWAYQIAITILILVILGLVSLYFLARFNKILNPWLTKITSRNSLMEQILLPRILSFINGLQSLTSPLKMVKSLFWILIAWFLYTLVTIIFIRAFIPSALFWWAIYLNGAIALGAAIPAGPGNIGVYEATVVGALSILHIPVHQALTIALVLHWVNWIIMSVLGLIGLSQLGYSFTDLFKKNKIS